MGIEVPIPSFGTCPPTVYKKDAPRALPTAWEQLEAGITKLMSYQVAWMQSAGQVPNKEASIVKLFAGELEQRISYTGMRALGPYATLWGDDAPAGGLVSRMYKASVAATIGGGTSEIQRGIIAGRGLGLPRV